MVQFTLGNDGKVAEMDIENLAEFERMPEMGDTTAMVALTAADLEKFTGVYVLEAPPIEMTVDLIGDALKLTVPGQPTYTLIPLSESRFRIGGAPAGYFVEFDNNGSALTVEQPNVTLKLTRKN
jgi:hypothetical protein